MRAAWMPKSRGYAGAVMLALAATAACSSSSNVASPGGAPPATVTDSGASATDAAPAIADSGAGSDTALPSDAITISADETWSDGKTIGQSVVIAPHVTVTVAPGAAIALATRASITVQGTLVGSSAAGAHASLAGASGRWGGIVVASGGTLSLDGVDLRGAGLLAQAGNAAATFDHATLDGVDPGLGIAPFVVDKGGTLSTAHAAVRNPGDRSTVRGAFTASYLDYDEKNSHAIYAADPSARVFIEDSTFHTTGTLAVNDGPDILNAYGAALFHLAYTDITGAHCGFHFESSDNTAIEIDHVTVHGVSNGADLWGSSAAGTKTIAHSNFVDAMEGLDVQDGVNGTATVSDCYIQVSSGNPGFPGADVKIASPASAAIADAHPR